MLEFEQRRVEQREFHSHLNSKELLYPLADCPLSR